MGISLYFTTTRDVTETEADAIRTAATRACAGRTWLSAEPVHFFPGLPGGKLVGGSKPNVSPHPDDRRAADAAGLPDGGPPDVIDVLCQLSRNHSVDWQLSHDFGEMGTIRGGVADPGVRETAGAFGDLGGAMDEFDLDGLE
jgi:hypothetical protein